MKVRCPICKGALNPLHERFRRNLNGDLSHEACAQKVQQKVALAGAILLGAVVVALL